MSENTYRVFKEHVDLFEGERITLPDDCIPLTVKEKSPTEVTVWYLMEVGGE